jgi:molybdopterin-guanine dinucleotide biosynthesis protein A
MQEKLNGIILAGGKSSRMGEDKGLMVYKGEMMVSIISRILKPLVSEISIITSNPSYSFLGYPLYKDIIPESGPAGGILTGLHYSRTDKNIVLACDTPNLSTAFLEYLLSKSGTADITVPVFQSRVHPLCGIYSKAILSEWERRVKAGELKLLELLKHFRVMYLNIDPIPQFHGEVLFANMNSPSDFSRYDSD